MSRPGQPGWVGFRDLGLRDRDLGNGDENFSIWTLQPGWPGNNIFDKIASLSQHFSIVCFFSTTEVVLKLKQCTKPYNSRAQTIQVCVPLFKFPKWTDNNFRPGNVPVKSTPQHPPPPPGQTPGIWRLFLPGREEIRSPLIGGGEFDR